MFMLELIHSDLNIGSVTISRFQMNNGSCLENIIMFNDVLDTI